MTQQFIEGTGEELIQVLHQKPKERFRLIELTVAGDSISFEEALAKATTRSPDEIAAARERLIQASPHPPDLPKGKTLEDVVVGKWPGDESDEQILVALRKLS